MSEKDDNKLCDLIARKKRLMEIKMNLTRSKYADNPELHKINSSESIIENSDSESDTQLFSTAVRRANIVINSSNEIENTGNDSDVMNTSTITLSRSHSFFKENIDISPKNNIEKNRSNEITRDVDRPFSYLSNVINIIQNEELPNDKIPSGYTLEAYLTPEKQQNTIEALLDGEEYLLYPTKNQTTLTALNNVTQRTEGNYDTTPCSSGYKKYINDNQSVTSIILKNTSDLPRKDNSVNQDLGTLQQEYCECDETRISPSICMAETSFPIDLQNIDEDITKSDANETDKNMEHTSTNLEEPRIDNFDSVTDTSIVIAKRKKRSIKQFTKSCMDFTQINENNVDFSSGSSDLWSEREESSDSTIEQENKKKQKRKRTRDKDSENSQEEMVPKKKAKPENRRKIRQKLKEKGLSYETKSGKVREARKLQENPCEEQKCTKKCYEISNERRKSIFDYYWSLTDERKRDWIVQSFRPVKIKRKKTKSMESRRSVSNEYFINEGEGRRQVCQQFLLKTLDISQTFLLYTINHANEGLSLKDKRKRTAANKYDDNTKLFARNYIKTLPALPSHYSRKKSTKLYLPEEFRNTSNLYRIYLKHCSEKNENYLSEKIFIAMFREYNFAFHIPKKDKCPICTKEENNPDQTNIEQIKTHLKEKEAAYKRFHVHQNMKTDDNKLVVASFDLQKVLATPHGESMMLYYSRKYAVYNFTVYESRTKNGFCYTWGESDGKRGSCEIATCLFRYLKEVDSRGVKQLLLYCDNCTGQNKNKVILSMIKCFLEQSDNLEVIQINYLLPGHTYMPVDSMHATIEREVKKLIVWAPSQWSSFMESARKRPKPYQVHVLEHQDFVDYNIMAEKVFTPATLKNKDLHFKKIRVCTFKKADINKMNVKYTMLEDGATYTIALSQEMQESKKGKGIGKRTVTNKGRGKNIENSYKATGKPSTSTENLDNLPSLYKERMPISAAKYNDLKKLCDSGIIPKRFHNEYLNLPYKTKVRDSLNETDEDDSDEEL